MVKTKAEETRRTILEATAHLILREGVVNLTLETVAKEAGVSKGGLLYHFPSKEALVGGLMAHQLEHFDAELRASERAGDGNLLRAYLETSLDPHSPSRGLEAALFAAVLLNPDLLTPLRERYRVLQREITAGARDPTRATLIRLAADGLWLTDLLGLGAPTGHEREALLALMREEAS